MTSTSFTDKERELIELVAREREITFEEAVEQLASEGLERRMRKNTRRSPCNNVKTFKRR